MNREYTIKKHQLELKVIIVMSVIAWFMRNKPYLSLLPSSRIITFSLGHFMGTLKLLSKTLFLTCSGLLGFYPVTGVYEKKINQKMSVLVILLFLICLA